MKYNIEKNIYNNKYECIFLNLYKNENINKEYLIYKKYIEYAKTKYNFKGQIDKDVLINKNNKKDIIIIGCGDKKKFNKYIFLYIIKKYFKFIKKNFYKSILFHFNNLNKENIYWKIFNIIKNFEELNYKFNKFKTKHKKNNLKNININFYVNKNEQYDNVKSFIKNSLIISSGIKKSKDLCNTPSNICNSIYIYKKIKKNIKSKNIKISYLNKKKIKKLGMNAYLSVNKGSSNKPLAIIIKYNNNNNNNNKPVILIGKGITFDSGGICIKKSNKMWEMKYDMSGASCIYGILYIVSKLKLNINIIGILACAENMVDKYSTKPGDIIKTFSKKTVEIINTDAEGRLILCDLLSYIKKYNPKYVIDIATLTGACLISLGPKINALISNNRKLSKKLIKASKESNNNLWELPLFKEYNKYLKSNIADIKNCSEIPYAGTITAACFLSHFTKKYKWAHIDIAGTAYNENGSTGQPIYIIIQFLINLCKN